MNSKELIRNYISNILQKEYNATSFDNILFYLHEGVFIITYSFKIDRFIAYTYSEYDTIFISGRSIKELINKVKHT